MADRSNRNYTSMDKEVTAQADWLRHFDRHALLVLRLLRHRTMTYPDIMFRTNLNPSAVWNALQWLVGEGIVIVGDGSKETRTHRLAKTGKANNMELTDLEVIMCTDGLELTVGFGPKCD